MNPVPPPTPTLLYHGTAARFVPKIFERGLRPRGRRKSNYADAFASDKRNVYLTTNYGPAYACRARLKWDEMLAVVEIDTAYLNAYLLRPDEDFLAQSVLPFHQNADAASRLAVHQKVQKRVDDLSEMWRDSLDGLGTVAYQGIVPPEAVTRVAIFNPKSVPEMVLAMSDVTLTLEGHLARGPQVAAWTRWLFDGPAAVRVLDFDDALAAMDGTDYSELPSGLREYPLLQEKRIKSFLNRWDVDVRVNPNYVRGVHADESGHKSTAAMFTT